jgi:hypothetical protein
MRAEYCFDYAASRPNRFAAQVARGGTLVVLDPDVAGVFRTSEAVNDFLRSVIAALPGQPKGKRRRSAALEPAAPKKRGRDRS